MAVSAYQPNQRSGRNCQHRAPSTEHRAPSTEHRAPSTEHPAQEHQAQQHPAPSTSAPSTARRMSRMPRTCSLFVLSLVFALAPSLSAQRPPVMGRNAGVSAGHPLTTAVAIEILQKGGNAFDAGVAAMLVGGVVEQDLYGFGGEGLVLVFHRCVDTAKNGIQLGFTFAYRQESPPGFGGRGRGAGPAPKGRSPCGWPRRIVRCGE